MHAKSRTPASKFRGVSLVEFMIYVALLLIISNALIFAFISLSKSYQNLQSTAALNAAAQVSLERILRETRDAYGYSVASSSMNVDSGDLMLLTTTGAGASTTVEFYLANQTLRVKEAGTDVGPLTPVSVRVTRLFMQPITTANSKAIKFTLTLETGTSTLYRQKTMYSSAVMRGSYPQQ